MSYSANNQYKSRKKSRQSEEHVIQTNCISWCQWQGLVWPELNMVFAIPNGGFRPGRGGAYMKEEGVKAGVPDLFLPVARRGWHGLFIEMKKPKGRVSIPQMAMMALLKKQDFLCYTIRSLNDFCDVLTWYLGYEENTKTFLVPMEEEKFAPIAVDYVSAIEHEETGIEIDTGGSSIQLPEHAAKTRGGWVELKTINGCGPYAYKRWRSGGRTRSEYIGKVKA